MPGLLVQCNGGTVEPDDALRDTILHTLDQERGRGVSGREAEGHRVPGALGGAGELARVAVAGPGEDGEAVVDGGAVVAVLHRVREANAGAECLLDVAREAAVPRRVRVLHGHLRGVAAGVARGHDGPRAAVATDRVVHIPAGEGARLKSAVGQGGPRAHVGHHVRRLGRLRRHHDARHGLGLRHRAGYGQGRGRRHGHAARRSHELGRVAGQRRRGLDCCCSGSLFGGRPLVERRGGDGGKVGDSDGGARREHSGSRDRLISRCERSSVGEDARTEGLVVVLADGSNNGLWMTFVSLFL